MTTETESVPTTPSSKPKTASGAGWLGRFVRLFPAYIGPVIFTLGSAMADANAQPVALFTFGVLFACAAAAWLLEPNTLGEPTPDKTQSKHGGR